MLMTWKVRTSWWTGDPFSAAALNIGIRQIRGRLWSFFFFKDYLFNCVSGIGHRHRGDQTGGEMCLVIVVDVCIQLRCEFLVVQLVSLVSAIRFWWHHFFLSVCFYKFSFVHRLMLLACLCCISDIGLAVSIAQHRESVGATPLVDCHICLKTLILGQNLVPTICHCFRVALFSHNNSTAFEVDALVLIIDIAVLLMNSSLGCSWWSWLRVCESVSW